MTPYYDDGQIVIYHGDCREVLPKLARGSVDLVLTDPPYGIDHHGRGLGRIANDRAQPWITDVWAALYVCQRDDTVALSFCAAQRIEQHSQAWAHAGYAIAGELVWVKPSWGFGRLCRGQHEAAYLLIKGQPPTPAHTMSTVQQVPRANTAEHPNAKPTLLLARWVAAYSRPGALLLDPFMGGGSVLVAAQLEGRRAIGIEIEERYCEIAVRRLAQQVLPLEVS